jgi:hypothetical protein
MKPKVWALRSRRFGQVFLKLMTPSHPKTDAEVKKILKSIGNPNFVIELGKVIHRLNLLIDARERGIMPED